VERLGKIWWGKIWLNHNVVGLLWFRVVQLGMVRWVKARFGTTIYEMGTVRSDLVVLGGVRYGAAW
jgi:hypothetical protein